VADLFHDEDPISCWAAILPTWSKANNSVNSRIAGAARLKGFSNYPLLGGDGIQAYELKNPLGLGALEHEKHC